MSAGVIDPRVLVVSRAFKQAVQMNAGAGSAINSHPNAFFLNVNGEVDFLKAAQTAVDALNQYDAAEAARKALETPKAKEAQPVVDETAASAVDGH